METIKTFIFVEVLAMFVTGVVHLFYYIFEEEFPLSIYPTIFGIVLACLLLVAFVISPIADWWFL